jgi:hypothetical protein
LLVDPDAGGDIRELKGRAHGVVGVDDGREGRFGGVVPFSCCRFAARILRRRDDLEVRVLELVVQCLPAWQIKSASSPGGPRDQEHFLAAELRQANETAGAIVHRDLGRDARLEEGATYDGHLAEAPHPGSRIRNHALPCSPRESREVELVASDHGRRDRDANISAAGTLGLQFEFIDPGEIILQDPQRVRNAPGVRPDVTQGDGATVVQHGSPGRRLTLT